MDAYACMHIGTHTHAHTHTLPISVLHISVNICEQGAMKISKQSKMMQVSSPPHNLHFPQSSVAVWKSRWPSWAFCPNEPYGFCGRKAILNCAHTLVTVCP